MSAAQQSERLFGLDLIRAGAILLVLLAHGSAFPGNPLSFAPGPTDRWSWISGVIGVELFYCLSGFLIGGLLIRIAAQGLTWRAARVFLVRRWMRTLPLYYLVLAAIAAFPALDPSARPHLLPYVLLVQNAVTPMPGSNWFGTSWSLVIEEWSYLLVVALALAASPLTKRPALPAACALCAAGFALRLLALRHGGDWDTTVRKLLLTRLDAIAWGMLLAWFWARDPVATLARARAALPASLPLLATSAWILSRPELLPTAFGRVLALPLLAVAFCMAMPALIVLPGPAAIRPVVRWLARASYALYLVHWSVMCLARDAIAPRWQFAFYVSVSVAAAAAASALVEQPVMRLRPRQA